MPALRPVCTLSYYAIPEIKSDTSIVAKKKNQDKTFLLNVLYFAVNLFQNGNNKGSTLRAKSGVKKTVYKRIDA